MSEHPADAALREGADWLDVVDNPENSTEFRTMAALAALAWFAASYLSRDVAYAERMTKDALALVERMRDAAK